MSVRRIDVAFEETDESACLTHPLVTGKHEIEPEAFGSEVRLIIHGALEGAGRSAVPCRPGGQRTGTKSKGDYDCCYDLYDIVSWIII